MEFKSDRSLIWASEGEKRARIKEAAKDVAAMANEVEGTIIYGIEESKSGTRRRASALSNGFGPDHTVSREWFIQTMRDHIHPPLPDLDAVEVPLDDGRFALVVLVPQAREVARQIEGLDKGHYFFYRRDAQGTHEMTVQEIEDVRLRLVRPSLDLAVRVKDTQTSLHGGTQRADLKTQFQIENHSSATASFAVITIGLHGNIVIGEYREWQSIQSRDNWTIIRCVLASGSSSRWSPITPGFTLLPEDLWLKTPLVELDSFESRCLGVARLDHDGGTRLYRVMLYWPAAEQASKLRLTPVEDDFREERNRGLVIPDIFQLPTSI